MSETSIAAIGGVELVDDDEGAQLHPLHQQLGDAVALGDGDRFPRVEVNETDLDFTAVSGVDGAGGVDDGKARTRGEPGPRVDEPDGPRRQGDGDARADQGALARIEYEILRRGQVDAGVVVMRPNGGDGVGGEQPDPNGLGVGGVWRAIIVHAPRRYAPGSTPETRRVE